MQKRKIILKEIFGHEHSAAPRFFVSLEIVLPGFMQANQVPRTPFCGALCFDNVGVYCNQSLTCENVDVAPAGNIHEHLSSGVYYCGGQKTSSISTALTKCYCQIRTIRRSRQFSQPRQFPRQQDGMGCVVMWCDVMWCTVVHPFSVAFHFVPLSFCYASIFLPVTFPFYYFSPLCSFSF